MRIFIFTTYFAPSVGGIERLTELLATHFAELGHDVALATLTPGPECGLSCFPVIRQPSAQRMRSLLEWCDVHLQTNLSLKYFWPPVGRTNFFISHQNAYTDASSKDGLRGYLKVVCARLVHGVACSRYIARRLGCGEVIGNPYDDSIFCMEVPLGERDKDIVFLGRLVSDKGCDTLLEALGTLKGRGLSPSCTVIGDGPERDRLVAMARSGGLDEHVRFVGALHGTAIAEDLNRHRIIAVPSRYREPFGIVALEGLACGCLPIVSVEGGLVDAIGEHGLTFRNGDPLDLANQLETALCDDDLARDKLEGIDRHLAGFTARRVAEKYLAFFQRAPVRAVWR